MTGAARLMLLWVLSFIFTSAIDAVWHLVLFKKPYAKGLRPLARMKGERLSFKGGAGLLAQALVVTSLVILVLFLGKSFAAAAVVVGALAGVLAISVYGVTNYALLKDWSLTLTVLEFVWGPILGGSSGLFIYWLKSLLAG